MTIKIIGTAPKVTRIRTNWYSFDRAFVNSNNDIGFPIGKGLELYGPPHCGKSTVSYGLAGKIAYKQEKNISLLDLEGFDPDFFSVVLENAGFDGIVNLIQEKTDEEALDELVKSLRKDNCVGVLDSIGAVSVIAEQEGEIGERHVGNRGSGMAQFSRKSIKVMRDEEEKGFPRSIIATNHALPIIGGRGKWTPGGEVKRYLFSLQIDMKRKYVSGGYEEFPDGSYVIEGTVVKNRWGIRGRKFNLFILSGRGVSDELTAVYDCLILNLAKKDRVIKIGDSSFGYLKNIVDEARNNNTVFFEPFFELLEKHEQEHIENNEEIKENDE
jgi:hypothetical protein